jgi:hypothetical protein
MTDAGANLRAEVMGRRRAALLQALEPLELAAATTSDLDAIATLLALRV